MRSSRREVSLSLALVTVLAAPALAGENVLLEAGSLWRCRMLKGTDLVKLDSGETRHLLCSPSRGCWARGRLTL